MEEINNQKANDKIEELEKAKQHLEQEVYVNKRRLEMETLATKQVTSCLSRHCCSKGELPLMKEPQGLWMGMAPTDCRSLPWFCSYTVPKHFGRHTTLFSF